MLKIGKYIFETLLKIILNILITWLFVWLISLCFDFTCTLKLVCGIYLITCLLRFRFQGDTKVNVERTK